MPATDSNATMAAGIRRADQKRRADRPDPWTAAVAPPVGVPADEVACPVAEGVSPSPVGCRRVFALISLSPGLHAASAPSATSRPTP